MIYLRGHLARPLDAVLAPPSRLAVLRQLARNPGPLTGRRLARVAGINHQSAAGALADLAALGVVRRSGEGRAVYWSLNRGCWIFKELLAPLFDKEIDHPDELVDAIKAALRDRAAAVLVAGDAAAGRLAPGGSVELLVVEGGRGRRLVGQALRELAALLRERWLLRLESRVVTREQAARAALFKPAWQLLPEEGPPAL